MTKNEAWETVMGNRSPSQLVSEFDPVDTPDLTEWIDASIDAAIRECASAEDLWPFAEWMQAEIAEACNE
jgi:hypothetical protein